MVAADATHVDLTPPRVLGRPVGADEAQAMLTAAARELDREFPGIKPRTLDNLIWRQERER